MTKQQAIVWLQKAIEKDYCLIELPYNLVAGVIELLAKAPEWVSVKDRLPGMTGVNILVAAETAEASVKTVFTAFLGDGDGKWYTSDRGFMKSPSTGDNSIHSVWEITHWMLMPEPPKEET